MSPAHLALVGPTATGKSALALAVARRLGDIEIVTVDSMQVYRGLDIGTAKPTDAERAEIPHHLVDVADPDEDYSLSRFQAAAERTIAAIERRGHRALLVGGTGLYLQAIVDDLCVPGRYPDVRDEVGREPDTDALWRRLDELDPVAASRMERTNRRRIVRALEVTIGSGRTFSSFGPGLDTYPPTPFRLAGVWLPRDIVRNRIAERWDEMLRAGLLDEARALRDRPLSATARHALGYEELFTHLDGRCSLEEAGALAVQRTVALSRRQRVWFRRDPRITWFATARNPVAVFPALLGHWTARCS